MVNFSSSGRRLRALRGQLVPDPTAPSRLRRAASPDSAYRSITSDGKPMIQPLSEIDPNAFPRLASARGLPSPASMSGISFRTNDLSTLSKFWATILDMPPTHAAERLHQFRVESDETFTITLMGFSKEEVPDRHPNDVAVDHFAISYASLAELLSTYRRLSAAGIKPMLPTNHGMTYSCYYMAPDGTQVELQVDAYRDTEGTRAWFQIADFAGAAFQPIDPDADAESFFSGKKTGSEILTRKALTEQDLKMTNGFNAMATQVIENLAAGKGVPKNQPSSWLSVPVGSSAGAGPPKRQVTPQYMAHFVLRTEQPEAAESFYQNLLGADNIWESPFIKFLSWDEEHHRVGVLTAFAPLNVPNAPAVAPRLPNSVGVHSIQWSYGSLQELLASAKRLQRRGILPIKALRTANNTSVSLFYHDQDKNICELKCGDAPLAGTFPAGEEVELVALEQAAGSLPLRGLPPQLPA